MLQAALLDEDPDQTEGLGHLGHDPPDRDFVSNVEQQLDTPPVSAPTESPSAAK